MGTCSGNDPGVGWGKNSGSMGHAKKIGLINLLKDGIKGATAL